MVLSVKGVRDYELNDFLFNPPKYYCLIYFSVLHRFITKFGAI